MYGNNSISSYPQAHARGSSAVLSDDESDKVNDSGSLGANKKFKRAESLPGSQTEILADELSSVATALLNLSGKDGDQKMDFLRNLKGVRIMQIAASNPEIREALNAAMMLDTGAMVDLSNLLHELSRTYRFSPDPLASTSNDIHPVTTHSLPGSSGALPSHCAQPCIGQEATTVQNKPRTSKVGQLRDYMMSGDSTREGAMQFARNTLKSTDVWSIVRQAAESLKFGASDTHRATVLWILKNVEGLSPEGFSLRFKDAAAGQLFNPSTSDSIYAAFEAYQKTGRDPTQLTYEALKEFMHKADLPGFEAYLTQPARYVENKKVTTARTVDGSVPPPPERDFPTGLLVNAVPRLPLRTASPASESGSVKRFKPTDDDEQPPGWPPVFLPHDHESSFPGATTAPIDSLQPAQPQHPGTEGFSGSFVLAGQASHSSSISSPLLIVPDDSMSETSSQDNSQAPASRENAKLDSTPAEFFDAMRKYRITRDVQSAPVPHVDVPAVPAAQLADALPSDVPLITSADANLATQSLWVSSNAIPVQQAINPLLQEAPEQT